MTFQPKNQHSNYIRDTCQDLEELSYSNRILVSGFEKQSKKSKFVEKLVIKECLHLRDDEKCISSCKDIENEYNIASRLSHENILSPIEYYKQYRGGCAISFPRASCDAFHYFIERSQQQKRAAYSLEEVRQLLRNVASALNYLHQGENIAHNDIKLENILCFISDDQKQVPVFMLTDFAYSYEIHTDHHTDNSQLHDSSFSSSLLSQSTQTSINVYPKWKNRVKMYLSPEMIESIQKQEVKMGLEKGNDILSLGFALFNIVFLENMIGKYEKEYSSSKKYQQIQKCGADFLQTLNQNLINTELEKKDLLFDLIIGMIQQDPLKRLDACGILNHPWLN
ncbi:kinase domain protein (macronuclear) [Tetrahymena thermophila SB210]|uniref:Kinase domain protein n=1 Tax=Tetrahymena thermophila (strain SB210) TaxID=312017 RepID=Q23AP9_TETTS|nr:kinase domain protein [Tetrahymena thermophila SB210]EAR93643.1 kinase domain protein [Tetrahymena thermophila SB210]|eukprot:XP_001013888.1 kinase domain protein [Tetrahymena thermophila SB210]